MALRGVQALAFFIISSEQDRKEMRKSIKSYGVLYDIGHASSISARLTTDPAGQKSKRQTRSIFNGGF